MITVQSNQSCGGLGALVPVEFSSPCWFLLFWKLSWAVDLKNHILWYCKMAISMFMKRNHCKDEWKLKAGETLSLIFIMIKETLKERLLVYIEQLCFLPCLKILWSWLNVWIMLLYTNSRFFWNLKIIHFVHGTCWCHKVVNYIVSETFKKSAYVST